MTIKLCCQCQTPITGGVYSSHERQPCHLDCDPNMPDYRERELRARVKKAEAERDTAWNDAIEAAAEVSRKISECCPSCASTENRIRALRKGEPK